MKLIYVGGPYSTGAEADIQFHLGDAIGWGKVIRFLGAVPVVPHLAVLPGIDCEKEGVSVLERCHGLFVMPGYQLSDAASHEVCFAILNDIPVFYTVGELAFWLENQIVGREFPEPIPPKSNGHNGDWLNWNDAVVKWEENRNKAVSIKEPISLKLDATLEHQAARHRRFLAAQTVRRSPEME